MKQRTILREASLKGKSLHRGEAVRLTIKPAPVDHGIVFKRIDLYEKPEIKPHFGLVTELVRSTDITSGHAKIHTIEHILSALSGCGVDNVLIEIDASEPPIMDGSAKHFVNMIQEAEPIEQDKEREYYTLSDPLTVTRGNRSITVLPYDGLKITCTSADDRGIHAQHLSLEIEPETYVAEIAPARTFTIYEDIEELLKMGKIRGGSLDSAIVIKGDAILSKEPLRFRDEFVRHKILDIIGDIVLLGKPLKAHIIAVRPGHALNHELTEAIAEQISKAAPAKKVSHKPARKQVAGSIAETVIATETELDISRILDILPHAYPFVMIDRVISIPDDMKLVAIKNVTINEPYFQGHFPGRPVMPGVLQIEAMAQAAGMIMLRSGVIKCKMAYFMSCDKVKFRRAVTPGDQMEVHVEVTKVRANKIAMAKGECRVAGKVVSSAELMFTIMGVVEE